MSLASRGSVLEKAVLGLGLGFFLCPWPWPRALCPRLLLCFVQLKLQKKSKMLGSTWFTNYTRCANTLESWSLHGNSILCVEISLQVVISCSGSVGILWYPPHGHAGGRDLPRGGNRFPNTLRWILREN